MKHLFFFTVAAILFSNIKVTAQDFDFQFTTYYYRGQNDTLFSSGLSLSQFNFSTADRATDSIFHDGIYFPASDCFGQNLWIRLRHVAEDPNGDTVGVNVPATTGGPCQGGTMLGGWAGFLYDIEIHRDNILMGARSYFLGALFPTSITVASLEWLGGPCYFNEWLSFVIMNTGSTGWNLNSINFTGVNPQSNPVFSDTLAVYTSGGCYPPDGFSYTFPTGADSISATSGSQAGLSEFKMSAGNVSNFRYGYEYTGLSGGYQGMSMAFGAPSTFSISAQDVTCGNGNDGQIQVDINGGIGPFTYNWNNGLATGDSLTGLSSGIYLLTVTDQNGCGTIADTAVIINEPTNVTVILDSVLLTNVQCHNGTDGSIQLYAGGNGLLSYLWNTGATASTISGLAAGIYLATITDQSSCLVTRDTISQPAAIDISTTLTGYTITSNETGATYQWINCNGNTVITDSISASITPLVSGDYKVAITKNGCTDTSACVHISMTGVSDNFTALNVSVYPNPASSLVNLVFAKPVTNAGMKLINMIGQSKMERTGITGNSLIIDMTEQVKGVYMVELSEEGNVSRVKIVKN